VLTILISVLGQIGDLVASYVKRQYETKDFSNLFPGHGGVMDRFDSVLFVGIVILLISEVVKLV
jgi:phosphatidate cytidylyltransferase